MVGMRVGVVVAMGVAVAMRMVMMAVLMPMPMPVGSGLDMMVMALLAQADFVFEADELLAVFAELAVHRRIAGADFVEAGEEGFDHLLMVVQIAGFDEVDPRVARRRGVDRGVDAVDQNPAEKEVGEDDQPCLLYTSDAADE